MFNSRALDEEVKEIKQVATSAHVQT